MSAEIAILIGYVVGTLVGIMFGFRHGVTRGSSLTIDILVSKNFVKWRKINGEIELRPLDSKD